MSIYDQAIRDRARRQPPNGKLVTLNLAVSTDARRPDFSQASVASYPIR